MSARTVGRLLLVGGGLLGALALGEVGARSLDDLALGFQYDGQTFAFPSEFVMDETVNQREFHDAPIGPPTADRILLIGDSFAASRYTSIDETPGQRLEHHTGRDVVTVAWPSWGQEEELRELKAHGPSLQPSLVISLAFLYNDLGNNTPALRAIQRQEQKRARAQGSKSGVTPVDEAPFFFVPGSRLNQFVSYRLADRSASDPMPVSMWIYVEEPPDAAVWAEAWTRLRDLLAATRDEVEEQGADYRVVSASSRQEILGDDEGAALLHATYPELDGYTVDIGLPARRFAAICDELALECLPLTDTLRAQGGTTNHWFYDPHWNAQGNDRAAAEIARWLQR